MASKDESILIVGAGVFGLTLAHELSRRGYTEITVLDRHLPPVPDGSSVDVSRIIRFDYADPHYMKMAVEAADGWETEYRDHYHESGILILSESGHPYVNQAKEKVKSQGGKINIFDDLQSMRSHHGQFAKGDLPKCEGYTNPRSGWAESAEAVRCLASQCTAAGVSFVTGSRGCVESLVLDGARVSGVDVQRGPPLHADHVVLATGAWSQRLIDLSSSAVSTGQPVGFVQLTSEEFDQLRGMPIAINLDSGFFVFPPTPGSNLLKCARHGYGYETRVSVKTLAGEQQQQQEQVASVPKTHGNGNRSFFLPPDAETSLHEELGRFLPPEIAQRPFVRKHLCWYTDTPQGDFIVDHHPDYKNLFLATGGSGHAFKFLPVLGNYLCNVFEKSAPRDLRNKWACKPGNKDILMKGDGSRGGPPRRALAESEQREFFASEGQRPML